MIYDGYGITPQGFVRMRLPEIRQGIVDDMRERLRARGIDVEPETRPDSVLGELIDTFSEREANLWELAEAGYLAMYPSTAFGVSLDRAISFSGAKPLEAEPAAAYVVFYGTQGSSVAQGVQVRNSSSQEIYELVEPLTISSTNTVDFTVRPTPASYATYRVTINGVQYQYVAGESPTLNDVITGLVSALSASGWDVTSDGAQVRARNLSTAGEPVSLAGPSAQLVFTEIGTRGLVRTPEASVDLAAPDQINTVVTTTTGLARVNNPTPGTAGRLQEEEFEKRERYRLGVFRLGAGTLPSIAPNIYEHVNGVSRVVVRGNDSDNVVNGLLPHSIHVIVEGGLDDEIAAAIYKFKGGGIDTNGATLISLQTPEGQQDIFFDRPSPIYIWVRAALTLKPETEDEPFPPGGMTAIREALVAEGNSLSIGEDVLLQKLYGPVYETSGIQSVDLRIAYTTTPAPPPDLSAYLPQNVSVGPSSAARFDLTRTEVF